MSRIGLLGLLLCLVPGACDAPAAAEPGSSRTSLSSDSSTNSAINERAVGQATGGENLEKSADGVVKVSFPRKDVDVTIDGWKAPPFMGLTSWAAFMPGHGTAEAMVMGDLVLFEDEVNPVMSALFDNGVDVTALHNHFFFDQPKVYFMHIGGEGTVASLGKGVKAALDTVAETRTTKGKALAASFGNPSMPEKSSIDAAKVEAALGRKGQAKDGMFKAVIGRTTSMGHAVVGKAMGVNTWAAFAGTNDNAVVDGDFAVAEGELQPVLRTLRGGKINIVAIHNHMTGESPRILFLHYWGRGSATEMASTIKKAIDQTASES